jgi:glucosamine--fructose-6-phosphate aminotransferase (isomerizing)
VCGIVGCVGYRDAVPMVLDGLARLEYRGYDSAGMAVIDGETLRIHKVKGKIADLRAATPADFS